MGVAYTEWARKLFYAGIYFRRKPCTHETHEIKIKAATKLSGYMVTMICRQRRALTNVYMYMYYQQAAWLVSFGMANECGLCQTHTLLILATGTFCITKFSDTMALRMALEVIIKH